MIKTFIDYLSVTEGKLKFPSKLSEKLFGLFSLNVAALRQETTKKHRMTFWDETVPFMLKKNGISREFRLFFCFFVHRFSQNVSVNKIKVRLSLLNLQETDELFRSEEIHSIWIQLRKQQLQQSLSTITPPCPLMKCILSSVQHRYMTTQQPPPHSFTPSVKTI